MEFSSFRIKEETRRTGENLPCKSPDDVLPCIEQTGRFGSRICTDSRPGKSKHVDGEGGGCLF
eukprot:757102-Hanusia_phi.AAC.1